MPTTNDQRPTTLLPKAESRRAIALFCALAFLFLLTSCRSDMQDQPRLKPLRRSDFFADGRSARPLVAGTVARGQLREDAYFYTGYVGNKLGDYMPFPATREVLERGRQRFNIYCAPCHSRIGDGNGMIVQRGYRRPPSFHIDRLRTSPIGHFYEVMANGFGAMPDYAAQVSPHDRWAIAAYIRALQFSQNAPAGLVPAGTKMGLAVPALQQSAPASAENKGGNPGQQAAQVSSAFGSANLGHQATGVQPTTNNRRPTAVGSRPSAVGLEKKTELR